jgi:hypothetical protein
LKAASGLEPKDGAVPNAAGGAAVRADAAEESIEGIRALACQGVRNRDPVGETDLFHLKESPRAYVWMAIRSKGHPFVIRHVYYHNAERYCEVSLDIRYPRMRTWSYVTLRDASQEGSWTVEITCNDHVLKTVSFRVVQ